MPSPFLVIGIGDHGHKVIKKFEMELEKAAPHYSSLAKVLLTPEADVCFQAIRDIRRSHPKLLGESQTLFTWMIGDLQELNSADLMNQQENQILEKVLPQIPGLKIHLENILIVPHGKAEAWKNIAGFLKKSECDKSLRSFSWLLSSGQNMLTEEELGDIEVKFLLLNFMTDLPFSMWAHGQLDTLNSRLGTFGLSGLLIPAEDLIRRQSARISTQILEEALKEKVVLPDFQTIETFLQRNRLSLEAIKRDLKEGAQISFKEKGKKIHLEESPPVAWPDKLWSIFYYFAFGGLSPYFSRIAQNLEKKWKALSDDLRNVITRLVEDNINPVSVLSTLGEFENRLAEVKTDRVSQVMGKEKLFEAIENLKKAYRNLPASVGAVLIRILLLSVLFAYLAYLLSPSVLWLPNLPGFVYFLASLGMAVIITGIVGFLSYKKKKNRFIVAQDGAENALWQALDSALDAKAHNGSIEILEKLQGTVISGEKAKEKKLTFDSNGEEYAAIWDYTNELRKALDLLKAIDKEAPPANPVLEYLSPLVVYRAVQIRPQIEAKHFIEKGLHKGWRTTKAEDLAKKILAISAQRLNSIKSLEEVILDLNDEERRTISGKMIEKGSTLLPLAQAASQRPVEKRYLFTRDDQDQVLSKLKFQQIDQVLSTRDAHHLWFLKTYLGVALEDIEAYRISKEEAPEHE